MNVKKKQEEEKNDLFFYERYNFEILTHKILILSDYKSEKTFQKLFVCLKIQPFKMSICKTTNLMRILKRYGGMTALELSINFYLIQSNTSGNIEVNFVIIIIY